MEDHKTRRKIILNGTRFRNKRQTAEQATAFARKAVEENELQRGHGAFRSAANTND